MSSRWGWGSTGLSLFNRGLTIRVAGMWSRRWVRRSTMVVFVLAVITWGIAGYYYVSFSRLIDQSLHGERLTLDAPVLSAIVAGEREKRRPVALSAMNPRMVEAVLAIEDHRFYEHPGVDPIGVLGALKSYATGRRSYLAGGSTLTQQL